MAEQAAPVTTDRCGTDSRCGEGQGGSRATPCPALQATAAAALTLDPELAAQYAGVRKGQG